MEWPSQQLGTFLIKSVVSSTSQECSGEGRHIIVKVCNQVFMDVNSEGLQQGANHS